jgi:hypothetical protein
MTTTTIEDIRTILINDYAGIRVDFEQTNGTTRLEMSKSDFEYLIERGETYLHKQTYGELKTELESKIQELREGIEAAQREAVEARLGDGGII